MIQETNENADQDVAGMKNIFRSCCKTFGDARTDDEIDSYFDELFAGKQTTESVSSISIQFSPDVELSNEHSRGHITVSGTVK